MMLLYMIDIDVTVSIFCSRQTNDLRRLEAFFIETTRYMYTCASANVESIVENRRKNV